MGNTRTSLTQRCGELKLGAITVRGYSVAGEETVVQIPGLGVCFDIGRAPDFVTECDILSLSHAHMDHVAGIATFLARRRDSRLVAPYILLHRRLAPAVRRLIEAYSVLDGNQLPHHLVPLEPGMQFGTDRGFLIRAFKTHHGSESLGYAVFDAIHSDGNPMLQPATARPLVTYLGDTARGSVFQLHEVREAKVLITECTFFDRDDKQRSRLGNHLHVDEVAALLPALNNDHVVLIHVSKRWGIRASRSHLLKLLKSTDARRAVFLMDFEREVSTVGRADRNAPTAKLAGSLPGVVSPGEGKVS